MCCGCVWFAVVTQAHFWYALSSMKKLFFDTRTLDAACRSRYGLTEEIMMENAAAALEQSIRSFSPDGGRALHVFILCGSGNNGADGYALLRRLSGSCALTAVSVQEPKSALCVAQAERAQKAAVTILPPAASCKALEALEEAEAQSFSSGQPPVQLVFVDCVFGSGFHGELDDSIQELFQKIEQIAARSDAHCYRLACDVPTGVRADGTVAAGAFCADCTVTMGAEKLSLYSDAAKDCVGTVVTADLGVSRALFEATEPPCAQLLERSDCALPTRTRKNSHKGQFGHVAVAAGEKIGAACIAGTAALRFGAGLVTLVSLTGASDFSAISPELMSARTLPEKTTALALGMGLGRAVPALPSASAAPPAPVATSTPTPAQPYCDWLLAHPAVPAVIDADALYAPELPALLSRRAAGIVLTPHAKEFIALLENCGCASSTAAPRSCEEALSRRPELMEAFCRSYPGAVLLVKGANVMIGQYDGSSMHLYVNPFGSAALSKAGSGDVLAGLIAALLAQGYTPLSACISGSLAHALSSRRVAGTYSLTPLTLIDAVAALELSV